MNEQIENLAIAIEKKEVKPLKPWHKPHINIYEMADAELGNGSGDDAELAVS